MAKRTGVSFALVIVALPAIPAGAQPLSAQQPPTANLVVNGSFEAPVLSDQSLKGESGFFATGTPGLAWTVKAVSGDRPLLELQRSTRDWLAKDGDQYAELDGYNPLSISQDLKTSAGSVYLLEYYWSPRPGPYVNQLQVNWAGTTIAAQAASYSPLNPLLKTDWRLERFLLAATSHATRLEFVETGPNDGRGVFLDRVSVTYWGKAVTMAVQPDRKDGIIHCRDDNELIDIAILSTDSFDASTIDPSTVKFQGAADIRFASPASSPPRTEDVNGDGKLDQVFQFRLSSTNLRCDARTGVLLGTTFDGVQIRGMEPLKMVSK